jgi:diacylglycerol kinase family enzyme
MMYHFPKVLNNRIKEFKEVELVLNESFSVELSKPYYLHIDGEMEAKQVKEFSISVAKEKIPFLIR